MDKLCAFDDVISNHFIPYTILNCGLLTHIRLSQLGHPQLWVMAYHLFGTKQCSLIIYLWEETSAIYQSNVMSIILENAFKNAACKILVILSRLQCVHKMRYDHWIIGECYRYSLRGTGNYINIMPAEYFLCVGARVSSDTVFVFFIFIFRREYSFPAQKLLTHRGWNELGHHWFR